MAVPVDLRSGSGYNGTAHGTSYRSVPIREAMQIMRRKFTAAALAAALAMGGVAAAQQTGPLDTTPVNVTVRLGAALPLDNQLSNLGNSLIDVGAEYIIPQTWLKGTETFVSVDYWFKSISFGQGSVVPLAINFRWYSRGGVYGTHRSYFFLGGGVDFIDVVSSNTALGIRAGFGVELGEHIIAEVAGYASDRAGGARADAVTFSVGYRF